MPRQALKQMFQKQNEMSHQKLRNRPSSELRDVRYTFLDTLTNSVVSPSITTTILGDQLSDRSWDRKVVPVCWNIWISAGLRTTYEDAIEEDRQISHISRVVILTVRKRWRIQIFLRIVFNGIFLVIRQPEILVLSVDDSEYKLNNNLTERCLRSLHQSRIAL